MSSDRPSSGSSENERPEKRSKKEIVLQHEALIKRIIVLAADMGAIEAGESGGVRWKQVFRSGKQQPVSIVEFSFPGGETFELVFRPTFNEFSSIFERHPVVRKYFPDLYLSQEKPYYQDMSEDVLVMERIHGYEEKHNGADFSRHISGPNNFDRLCSEVFEMIDELYHEPLILYDVDPTYGHNVFYNAETDRFQLFDVDTIKTSDQSHERKFMEFVDLTGRSLDEKQIAFLMRMIQLYRERYPESHFSYETDEFVRGEYVTVPEPTENEEGLIRPGNPEYEEAYRTTIDWLGTRGREDLPSFRFLERKGKNTVSVRRDLLEAIKRDDPNQVKRILEQNNGGLIEKKFIEIEE